MKKIIIVIALSFSEMIFGQVDLEMSKIGFYPYAMVDKEVSPRIQSILESKLENIILQNSLGDIENHQFVLLAKLNLVDEMLTATVPPVYKVVYNVDLIVADNLLKRKFGIYAIDNCVGINKSKERAIVQAISRVRSDKLTIDWLNKTKDKIIEYYKNNCALTILETDALRNQKRYDEAIALLTKIPKVTEDCFTKAQEKMVEIYKQKELSSSEDSTVTNDQKEQQEVTIEKVDDLAKDNSEENYEWILTADEVRE